MSAELRKSRFLFADELWNPFAVCAVPVFVFKNGTPVLAKNEDGVFVALCEMADAKEKNCVLTFNLRDMEQLTGYDARTVKRAIKGLKAKRFIRPVGDRKNGSRNALTFELTNPENGEGLSLVTDDKREHRNLRSALYHADIGYMNVPVWGVQIILKHGIGRFVSFRAFARIANLVDGDLRHAEKQVAVAGRYSARNFRVQTAEVRKLSGLDRKTFKREYEALNDDRLLRIAASNDSRTLEVTLVAPGTEQTLDEFEEDQKQADDDARRKRYEEENQERRSSPEEVLAFAIRFLKDCQPKIGSEGDFLFFCPECHNLKTRNGRKQHRPRFSVNPFKGFNGLAFCYDCEAGRGVGLVKYMASRGFGGYFELLMMLQSIGKEAPECYAAAQQLLGGFGGNTSEQVSPEQRKRMRQQLIEQQRAEQQANPDPYKLDAKTRLRVYGW